MTVNVNGSILLVGALLALPLFAASGAMAKSHHHAKSHHSAGKTDSTAYPGAPGGTPAASDKGKPVEPKANGGADKPAPPAKASTEGAAPGGVQTPTTAYPGSPVKTPASTDDGKAPK